MSLQNNVDALRTACKGSVRMNAPLAPMTTFRIGGPADLLVEPVDADDIITIQRFIRENGLPLLILGNGSNVLISDDGWRGVVMNLEHGFTSLAYDDGIVSAGAGVKMAQFVDFCIKNRRKGVEMLAGIPATIGGAVWMNAGCYGGETADTILDVDLVRDDSVIRLPKEQCDFRYRHSGFRKDDIIIGARFAMDEGDPVLLAQTKRKHLLHRNEVQPVQIPNCGSVFKNPHPRYSAELIESAGLKGMQIGGAQISPKHANFIVNIGNASAQDVIALMNLSRKIVYEKTGIMLEPEVQLIGFAENPLLPLPEIVAR
jgi:UDP-N-acetylmuramate dehydrogenase